MRLTRVRIHGFKTFADRCEFSVDGGLVAVVGPNGCGKSNLVDAILWGLGEGSARTLRAVTGTDVIFNGSAKRRPQGFAEVTLTFDNEDHALPLDVAEVAITRRIERSGDSTYQINRRACRLKDIHELFADSGLGRSGYAIVGQKEIDAALSAGAEERRAWIDEAAGVQRYRVRKAESLRRLASAREHLARVLALENDLEMQRIPLEKAATRARRYQELSSALREVEIGILARAVAEAREQMRVAEEGLATAREAVTRQSSHADELDLMAKKLGEQVSAAEAEMDVARNARQLALTTIERAEAAIALVDQKLVNLQENRTRLEQAEDELRQRLADAQREAEIAENEEIDERKRLDELSAERIQDQERLRPLRDEVQLLDRAIAEARKQELARVKRRTEAELQQQRRDEALAALPELEDRAQAAESALARAIQDCEAIRVEVEVATSSARSASQALQAAEAHDRKAQATVRESLGELSAMEGRVRGLTASLASHDSLSFGARSILAAVDQGNLPDRYRPVTSAFDVEADYALAIEVALGSSVSDLIVPDAKDAERAIEWLRANRAGRATFQPRSLMRPPHLTSEFRAMLNSRGVIGRASECVECREEDRGVIESLLGRIVLVETLDDALKLAKTSGWNRLVALSGDVVHSSGAVTGGQAGKAANGVVRQRAELNEMTASVAQLRTELEDAKANADTAAQQLEAARQANRSQEASLREIREKASQANAQRKIHEQAAQVAVSTREKQQRAITALSVPIDLGPEPTVDVPELEQRREDCAGQLAVLQSAQTRSALEIDEARLRVQQARTRRGAADRRLAQAWESEQDRTKRLAAFGPEERGYETEKARAQVNLREAHTARETADATLERVRGLRAELLQQSFATTEDAKGIRQAINTISESMRQFEIDRTRADGRRAVAFERLFEEYGMGEEDAVAYAKDLTIHPDSAAVVTRLRREIRDLGDVSLGSIDAYEELNGRLTELTAQRVDVEDGIAQVELSIDELDRLTRDRFVSTFELVRTAFGEIFTRLFGGGEATLELTTDEKLLESGVDVLVTLPGKKRQSLALLSGGERALCAVAFLFALLKTRPSPLVVLDEVDAPLDGRNVERFASELGQLATGIQFLVITHNPRTIELAPIWLGVTMQEPGVSTLIPTKVDRLDARE
jgi:chromosome segregation protein